MKEKRSVVENIKRYAVMTVGLYLTAFAVVLSVASEWGTSPISTMPNVLACIFTNVTLGTFSFLWNVFLIFGQLVILRKNFRIYQLLQIPLSFVFGLMIDLNKKLVSFISFEAVWTKIVAVVAGCLILGFAVAITVKANVLMNSGEAIVKAVSDTFGFKFSNVKIALDISYVALGTVISLIALHTVKGVGIATVILAVCTGFSVKLWQKILGDKPDKFFAGKKAE